MKSFWFLFRELLCSIQSILWFLLAVSVGNGLQYYWHKSPNIVLYFALATFQVTGLAALWWVIAKVHLFPLEKALSDAKKWEILATEGMNTELGPTNMPENGDLIIGQIRDLPYREVRVYKLLLKPVKGWSDEAKFVYMVDPTELALKRYFNNEGLSYRGIETREYDFDSHLKWWLGRVKDFEREQGIILVFDEELTPVADAVDLLECRCREIMSSLKSCYWRLSDR